MKQKRVLTPSSPWWELNTSELIASRELIWFLFRRDFLSDYKQTVAGPLWFLIQPLGATIIFTIIFGNFAGLDTQGMPPFLFYHAGLLQWTFLQGVVSGCSGCLFKQAGLYRKIYFPRLVAPLVELLNQLWKLLLNLFIFSIFYFYFLLVSDAALEPGPEIFLLPGLFLLTALLASGIGMFLCALSIKYRDIKFILPLALQFWMFLSPVMYSNQLIQGPLEPLFALNPMFSILSATRVAFTGQGVLNIRALLHATGISFGLFTLGLAAFQKAQQNFIDRI